MVKKRVPLHQNPRGFVDVDPDATNGAQVGVNLRGPDGQILTAAQVINPTGGSSGGPSSIASTIWKLIREVPSNIQKLAALIGAGFAARQSNGDWALRSLQEGAGIDIANPDGDAGNPTIGLEDVANSGTGTLLAISRDGKGRVTGTRPATITGTAGRVAVANGDASAGLPTIDLAPVSDSGAGVLLAITKDAYGRVTGTRQATITGTAQQINVANGTAAAGLPTLSLAAEVTTSLGKADTALQPGAVHNTALSGLQGGSSTERYHSTAIQNSSLAAVAVSGEICGLQMVWNSGTSITFTSGFAAIQSLGGLLSFPSPITKAGLSLSASTWYHAYGYSNAGTPDVEIVTTAPASTAFSGSARSKTGDTSRRYLGSLLTDASGNIYRFGQNGDEINYVVNLVAPFRVLSGGMATTRTNVALSGVIPVTSNYVIANTINNADQQVFIDIPEIGNSGAASRYTCLANQRTPIHAFVASRTLQYLYGVSPVGSGAFIDVWGYRFER